MILINFVFITIIQLLRITILKCYPEDPIFEINRPNLAYSYITWSRNTHQQSRSKPEHGNQLLHVKLKTATETRENI